MHGLMAPIHRVGLVVLDAKCFEVDQDSWLKYSHHRRQSELSSSARDPLRFGAHLPGDGHQLVPMILHRAGLAEQFLHCRRSSLSRPSRWCWKCSTRATMSCSFILIRVSWSRISPGRRSHFPVVHRRRVLFNRLLLGLETDILWSGWFYIVQILLRISSFDTWRPPEVSEPASLPDVLHTVFVWTWTGFLVAASSIMGTSIIRRSMQLIALSQLECC